MGNMSSVMNTDPPKVHRNLCGLRYDNRFAFGATSARGITTTCFNDVVLEPLATWILLAILLPILAVVLMQSRHNTSKSSSTPLIRYRRTHQRWARLMVVLNIIYLLLVLAALLMNILQIVRLALANRGIGLLPFNLAGILIMLVLMHLRSTAPRAVSLTILGFWSLLLAFTAVSEAGFSKLKGVEDRLGTEYLLSDEALDVGVQIGLYAIFWLFEATRLLLSLGKRRTGPNSVDDTDELRHKTHLDV